MKLQTKLPLAFAAAVLLVFLTALFGIYTEYRSLQTYATTVRTATQQEQALGSLTIEFKVQVQEWKNTLLRGKDPQALDKHWSAFTETEKSVARRAEQLVNGLPPGAAKSSMQDFMREHATMGANYRKGFEAFKASGLDPAAGDAFVKGMDRAPTKLLEDVARQVAAMSLTVADEADRKGRSATQTSLLLMLVVCAAGIGAGIVFSRAIVRQLGADPTDASAVVERVAEGDLSGTIELIPGDSTSLMARMKDMQTRLTEVVSSVRQGSESVASAASEIATGNHDLSSRTEQQASALEQTSASMEELGAAVRQNADNAHQADVLARNASDIASRGGEVFERVVETMKGITDSSHKIADIISVIDSIAFQTNILALNAAVEAARAGEQGRGFAVVAGEVRQLAGRSAEAAKEIKTLIQDSVERIEQGSRLVNEAGDTMSHMVSSIREVTHIMGGINTATAEQSNGVHQVVDAVALMDQATQQNAALVEEMAAAASSLRHQSEDLVRTVARFKLG